MGKVPSPNTVSFSALFFCNQLKNAKDDWLALLCVCGVDQGSKNLPWRLANILLCFLFIKPTYAHLTYTIQSFVYFYIVWWNSTFVCMPLLKANYIIIHYSSNTRYIVVIYAAKLKKVRSHKMWLKVYMLVYCTFCRSTQTSNLILGTAH